ncbi:hypothetical protein [Mesorhizobium sp. 128a]
MITMDNAIRLAISLTLLFIGFQMGAIWGAQPGVNGWLYMWQTLFAGLMAIGAALLTVFAMFRTDAKQQERHNEIYALTLRRDILAVERAAHMDDFYRRLADDIAATTEKVKAKLENGTVRPSEDDVDALINLGKRFNIAVNMTLVKSAADLFGPRMAQVYEALGFAMPGLEIGVNDLHKMNLARGDAADHKLHAEVLHYIGDINHYIHSLVEFADCLVALGDRYHGLQRPFSPS